MHDEKYTIPQQYKVKKRVETFFFCSFLYMFRCCCFFCLLIQAHLERLAEIFKCAHAGDSWRCIALRLNSIVLLLFFRSLGSFGLVSFRIDFIIVVIIELKKKNYIENQILFRRKIFDSVQIQDWIFRTLTQITQNTFLKWSHSILTESRRWRKKCTHFHEISSSSSLSRFFNLPENLLK